MNSATQSPSQQQELVPSESLDDHSSYPLFAHWVLLGLSTVVLLACYLLEINGPETVSLSFAPIDVPPSCGMKRMFDLDCPGCGLTRSFISLAHGNLIASLNFNPSGVLLFAVMVFQIPYQLGQIIRIKRGLPPWDLTTAMLWVFAIMGIVMLSNWLIRLFF